MYQQIRYEGLAHSHVMEFASALMDGIGPRLTGSPNLQRANEWTRDQLAAMGCTNAHLEDWGEFGMGWQQLNTWTRMAVARYRRVHHPGRPLVAIKQRRDQRASDMDGSKERRRSG